MNEKRADGMTRLFCILLTLLFCVGDSVTGENGDFGRFSIAANSGGRLAGSGSAAGVLEVSPLVKSTKAFQNYNPGSSVEFVFDASSNRFVVGRAAGAGSPHQNLAATINGDSSVVGGMFQRGSNGQILTNEFSGHYWQNWTPQIRTQFQGFLESSTGQSMIHTP